MEVEGDGVGESRVSSSVQGSHKLLPPQWVNCDLRYMDMTCLGKFSVVMADPPWDIHMELPYGACVFVCVGGGCRVCGGGCSVCGGGGGGVAVCVWEGRLQCGWVGGLQFACVWGLQCVCVCVCVCVCEGEGALQCICVCGRLHRVCMWGVAVCMCVCA